MKPAMDDELTIFISHVQEDEALAHILTLLLGSAFPGAKVFVSGRDLTGGGGWFEELRQKLAQSKAIVLLLTRLSVSSRWVHFEAGVGFVDNRTIPLLAEGVTPEDLNYPLRQLQARKYDKKGLGALAARGRSLAHAAALVR